MNKFILYLKFFISGLAFGIANVIPGVSGGTMLVVFGIYDKLTEAISGVKAILKNFGFLLSFVLGAGAGILGFAFVITWLFEQFGVQTNMFFIGLILGSVPLIVRTATKTEKVKPLCVLPFIVGLAAVVGLTILENANTGEAFAMTSEVKGDTTYITISNNSDREIDSWYIDIDTESGFEYKDEISGAEHTSYHSIGDKIKKLFGVDVPNIRNRIVSLSDSVIPAHSSYTVSYRTLDSFTTENMELGVSYSMDIGFFLTMLAALFIAAVSMIIPGVSGSFVMMLLGVYSTVIAAIKNFDIMIIIPCAIGAILGIILGAKLISTLLKKYSLMVYSAIMGLVIGSVYAILPTGFGFNLETGYGFMMLFVGILTSVLIDKLGGATEEK